MHSPAESADDSPPPISPLQRQGVIEIDTFCAGCHYNLHGQVVSIDERLGFPICRCPECGKFHPAGTGVTAAGVWTRRFASILLFIWIAIVINCQIAVAGGMAGLDALSIGLYSHGEWSTSDGQPVVWGAPASGGYTGTGYVLAGTNIPAKQVVFNQKLHPWNEDSTRHGAGLPAMLIIVAASLLLGFMAQTLAVSLLWHWPKRRYLWLMIVAIIPALLVMIPFITTGEYQAIKFQCLERIFSQTGFQCAGINLGIFLGRPLARQIVRMFIPPKPRQALAFLWLVDGKKPPTTTPG